ncbi:MAG: CoA ester lyase [Clostridiales Family XIII bacterium]|jgi:citrate lyase subunit beta/citryl-CoA lyase|nr:CoA ester lyase [Clostridiales Family XIII bacterium]
MKVIRSNLYIPANNPVLVDKCAKYPADNVTFDIEDAVPPQEKQNARKMAAANLEKAGSNGAEVYVRVNGWHTEYTHDDLEAVVLPGLDGITLPKTRNIDDVKRLDQEIGELEDRRGIPPGTVKIALLLETAEGIMNAYSIVTASKRTVAAFFGAVDYCADMRIARTNEASEQAVARTIVAIAARSAGIVALDAPFADYSNMDAFRKNTLDGRRMGFEGRMLIHPSQIAVAHELYSPTEEEITDAERVKKFFEEEGLAKGLASVSLDGKMVDTPVYQSALNVLDFRDAINEKDAARAR